MNANARRVAVLGGTRIPFARQNGPYARASNQDMLTATLDALAGRSGLEGEALGEVAAGAVLKHSRDFSLTRESVLGSKLAPETPADDVQQACGTGLETTIVVANKIALGQIECGIAGGVDTTSDVPLAVNDDLRTALLDYTRARSSTQRLRAISRIRPQQLAPEIPRNAEPRTGPSMGEHCAIMARDWGIARAEQDALAVASHAKLHAAFQDGFYDDLVVPFLGLERDQNLRPDSTVEKLAKLKPVFGGDEGTMTAGNSTPLSDGASAVLLASEQWARDHEIPVQAHLVDAQTAAVDHVHKREGLLMAPAYAMPRMLARAGRALQEFDFYEIHEAFAAQVLCTLRAWEDPVFCTLRLGLEAPLGAIDPDRINVRGGSLGAGHPFGATGGRIVATLAKTLHERGEGTGVISICAAGGVGVTAILERPVADRYQQLVNAPVGRLVATRLGLPRPPLLRRHAPGDRVIDGEVLLGAPGDARLTPEIAAVLAGIGAEVATPMEAHVRAAAAQAGVDAAVFNSEAATRDRRFRALVLDATGIDRPERLIDAYSFLHAAIRRVRCSGRVIVLGTQPHACEGAAEAIVQRALEGLVRSLAKELRGGATGQLVYVTPGGEQQLGSTLRFLLSARSAFVDGQVIRIGAPVSEAETGDWAAPLSGATALVTGAARGIGAAIAQVLARDGAHVVGVDVEPMADELHPATTRWRG